MSNTITLIKEAKQLLSKLEGTPEEIYLIMKEIGISESVKNKLLLLLPESALNVNEVKKEEKGTKQLSPMEQVENYLGWKRECETLEQAYALLDKISMEEDHCYMVVILYLKQRSQCTKGLLLSRPGIRNSNGSRNVAYHITNEYFISSTNRRMENLDDLIEYFME